MAEYYKTQQQLQAGRRKSRRDDEIGAAVTVALVITAGVLGIRALKKNGTAGVGRANNDPQLSLDYSFDDELQLFGQQPRTKKTYDPEQWPDIEAAWAEMERHSPVRRRELFGKRGPYLTGDEIVVDRGTGDGFNYNTVFEVYARKPFGQLEQVLEITGDDLEYLTERVSREIKKAESYGYELDIYEDGSLVETVNENFYY